MPLLPLGLSPSDFLFAFVVAIALVWIGWMLYKVKRSPRMYVSPIPNISDENFESLLSLALRERITREFYPHHATAHTAREISAYTPDHPYLPLLTLLEEREYQSLPLDPEERKKILETLEKSSRK